MPSAEKTNYSPRPGTADRTRRRMPRWLRIVLWSTAFLAVLVLAAFVTGTVWLRTAARAALPVLDGDLHLAGLSAPVSVRRDGHGVPHIEAASQDDLFLAQGYVTAQDRLWQMDAFRRNANGELAAIMGPSMVRHDKAQRVLQFRNTAQRIYDHLPPAERRRLDDYARGVNLFIDQHPQSLPVEFRLLGYRPGHWSGRDSLSVGMMMIETLDSRWDTKLSRDQIRRRLKDPRLEADLYPTGSWRDHPPTGERLDLTRPHPVPASPPDDGEDDDERTDTRLNRRPPPGGEDMLALRAALGLASCSGCTPGSNNWVVSGQHTASGRPLLSNDMHLSLTAPNIWYMADLRAPGYHAAGVTLVGMPYVIAGHNEHVSWGFTALYADVQDLYVEALDGRGDYRADDGSWRPLAVDHEVIEVRASHEVSLDVRSTAHGPLLNPLFTGESRPIALRWTLYDAALNSIPVYAMNTASNWGEFSDALQAWSWPTQNVVYADDQGHIGYHAVGRVPLRPSGLAGVPIEDGTHEWHGYLPFASLPGAFDPPSGFLATANSRVTSPRFPGPLTLDWSDPYRAERIYKALEGREKLRPEDMLAVQNDVYSEVDQELGHRFAYAIDHAPGTDERLRKAADLMRSWDGTLSTDSAAASVVTRTRETLKRMILEPRLGAEWSSYQWPEANFAEEEIVMHGNPDWLPPGFRDWDAAITEAVRRAMKQGKAPSEISRWDYGSWHVIDIEHPLAPFLPLIGRVAGTGAQPLSGDSVTVKQVGRAFGPSQRFTMDWSNVDGSTENIVLGESGNPLSPYFRDQWEDYYGGATFSLPFTAPAVVAATRHTLNLLP